MQASELKSLLDQYIAGTLSQEDFKRLWETLEKRGHDDIWLQAIQHAIDAGDNPVFADHTKAAEALEKIKSKIAEETLPSSSRIYRLYDKNKWKFNAAAAILIVITTVLFINFDSDNNRVEKKTSVVINTPDVEPGGEKAILTLSDGTKIVLDNAAKGQIAQQGTMQVIKLSNGQIVYKAFDNKNAVPDEISFNTMSTPRGGQYRLILPDGSQVWLNAESSITYPTAFSSKERRVEITGEVYFEVAKDKHKPFRVLARGTQIEVLGTHFNVNAYKDDGAIKTSLLEGSVKIDNNILIPGQAYTNGRVVATNTDQDVAWKNGVFNFNNQSLSQVMLQLARWYDLEVVYPGSIPKKEYGGEIGRNLTLMQVLKGLEQSGLRFELVGKKVIVTSATIE